MLPILRSRVFLLAQILKWYKPAVIWARPPHILTLLTVPNAWVSTTATTFYFDSLTCVAPSRYSDAHPTTPYRLEIFLRCLRSKKEGRSLLCWDARTLMALFSCQECFSNALLFSTSSPTLEKSRSYIVLQINLNLIVICGDEGHRYIWLWSWRRTLRLKCSHSEKEEHPLE